MKKRIRHWLFLVNYYAHDFFTGMWCSSFLVIYLLHKCYPTQYSHAPCEPAVVCGLKRLFFFIEAGALIFIIFTGMIRSMDDSLGYPDATAKDTKKHFMVVKHILMGCFFLICTMLGWWWALTPDFQWRP